MTDILDRLRAESKRIMRVVGASPNNLYALAIAAIEQRDAEIARLREALTLARSALPDSDDGGPDGTGYAYVWDECTVEEQAWVKQIAERIAAALAAQREETK